MGPTLVKGPPSTLQELGGTCIAPNFLFINIMGGRMDVLICVAQKSNFSFFYPFLRDQLSSKCSNRNLALRD